MTEADVVFASMTRLELAEAQRFISHLRHVYTWSPMYEPGRAFGSDAPFMVIDAMAMASLREVDRRYGALTWEPGEPYPPGEVGRMLDLYTRRGALHDDHLLIRPTARHERPPTRECTGCHVRYLDIGDLWPELPGGLRSTVCLHCTRTDASIASANAVIDAQRAADLTRQADELDFGTDAA